MVGLLPCPTAPSGALVHVVKGKAEIVIAGKPFHKEVGLRGRGGGGLPTGLKWAGVAHGPCLTKYLVCNVIGR